MFEYDNIVYEDNKPGEPLVTLCEDTFANEMLGWKPTLDIEDYIKSYINEEKHNIHTKLIDAGRGRHRHTSIVFSLGKLG